MNRLKRHACLAPKEGVRRSNRLGDTKKTAYAVFIFLLNQNSSQYMGQYH